MFKLLTKEQIQFISGGANGIAVNVDDNKFVLIPADGIPKRCANSLEYAFNEFLKHEFTTTELLTITMAYGKCSHADHDLFLENLNTVFSN